MIALFTWIDGHVQFDVEQWSTNSAINLNKKIKMTHIEQTLHLFLSCFLSLPFIFTICVNLFTGDTHPTEQDFRQMMHPSDSYQCLFGGNIFLTSTMHQLCEHTDL